MLAQIALDRLQTYLDGDALTLDAFLDRAALGRSADHWAAQLGLDPASAKADLVQDRVAQAEADSDGDAWQFEPDPAVADAMAEVKPWPASAGQEPLLQPGGVGDRLPHLIQRSSDVPAHHQRGLIAQHAHLDFVHATPTHDSGGDESFGSPGSVRVHDIVDRLACGACW